MPTGGNFAKILFWLAVVIGFSYLLAISPLLDFEDTGSNAMILTAWKGAGVWLLAVYAWLNARSLDGMLLVGVMALGSLGDVLVESDIVRGGIAFGIGHLIAISLYLRNRRTKNKLTTSQIMAAFALVALTPIITAILTKDGGMTGYSALLGGMAACAWMSRFSRYTVGIGAVMFIASDLLIFSNLASEEAPLWQDLAIWGLYFAGQVLIVLGVTQALAKDEVLA